MSGCVRYILAIGSVLAVAMSGNPLYAQKQSPAASRPHVLKDEERLFALADGRGDSIVLRWVPSSDILWQMGNKYGYTIERFTAMRNGKLVPGGNKTPKRLTSSPLKPLPEKEMDKLAEKEEYAGVVGEALYGDDFKVQLKSESPADIINQAQQSQNRYGFALLVCDFSPAVAKAAGLLFVDKGTKAGEKYIYRIRIAMPDSLSGRINYKPGVTMLAAGEAFLAPAIKDLKAQFGDRAVALGWNMEMLNGIYTAFNIERSTDGEHFVKVNRHPFLQMSTRKESDKYAYYVDSLSGNYMPYYYRVTGITPFGQTGPYSDTIRGEGLSRLDYRPFFDSIRLAENGSSANIRWTLPDSIRRALSGIYIAKAPKAQGPYTDINEQPFSADQTTAVDPAVVSNSNYYRLRLLLKDGRQVTSLPYYLPKEDSIPPGIPLGFGGTSNSKGIARIWWTPNREKDLRGYRVFRSQVKKGEYFEITKKPIRDTMIIDTLNLGFTNPYVYYKIISVDNYYNSSDYSAPIAIRRPDTIPPVPVVFSKLYREDTLIHLSFLPSASEDVKKYSLRRYYKEGGGSETVAGFGGDAKDTLSFTDAPPVMGKTLIYEIAVTDSAGNTAISRSGELFFETGFRRAVGDFQAAVDRGNKRIRLSWQYSQFGIDRFIIYRSSGGARFQSYATLDGNVFSYEDRDLNISNTYKYKIKAVLKNGIESVLTKETSVDY